VIGFPGLGSGTGAKTITAFTFSGSTETANGSPVGTRTLKEAQFTEVEMKLNTIPAITNFDTNTKIYLR